MQETKIIDGKTFIIDPMGAMSALKLKVELVGVFAPAISSLISKGGAISLDSETDINGAIESLVMSLTEAKFESLSKKLMTRANVCFDGNPQMQPLTNDKNFDYAFQQNLLTFYKVVWFVIEVNYKDFLGKMGNIGDLKKTFINSEPIKSTKSSKKSSAT
jgi:hypothetical protein